MMLTLTEFKLLDVVALRESLPDKNLCAGQVGTIVEYLAPDVFEVEFSDDDGQTYAMLPLKSDQLLKLYYHLSQEETMTTNIHQHGSGDNVAGDKVMGDKIDQSHSKIGIGVMKGGTISNGAIVAGEYNEGSNSLEDVFKLISLMRESVALFPQEQQEDLVIDLDDLEAEINKPEADRRMAKIKKCLTALATAGTMAIATLGAANTATVQLNTFVDNASTLANKFQIELPINASTQNPN
jgi:Domain of unknown function (DUF4926)